MSEPIPDGSGPVRAEPVAGPAGHPGDQPSPDTTAPGAAGAAAGSSESRPGEHPPHREEAAPRPERAQQAGAEDGWPTGGEGDAFRNDATDRDLNSNPSQARDLYLTALEGGGPTAVGRGSTAIGKIIYGEDRAPLARVGVLREHHVEAERRTYVEVAEYSDLEATVKDQRVLVLRGPKHSGRRATALRLLAERCGDGRVAIVDLEPGVSLDRLPDLTETFRPGYGHIVEMARGGGLRATFLAALADEVARPDQNAYVVLVETDDRSAQSDLDLGRWVGRQSRPDLGAVFRNHLCEGVDPDDPHDADWIGEILADPDVITEFDRCHSPAAVARLAQVLAVGRRRGDSTARSLTRLRGRARLEAERALRDTGDVPASDAWLYRLPRRQAFRIAYAVLDGLRLGDVIWAADLLIHELRQEEAPESNPVREVFTGSIDELLPEVSWTPVMVEDGGETQQRRAALGDPALSGAVLDVAWNDYDSLRIPLMRWFGLLVLGGRDAVAMRAAFSVGLLATYDYDEVFGNLVRSWAKSPSGRLRRAAAWACAITANDPRHAAQVRDQISGWASSKDSFRHDTAVRAYSTAVSATYPDLVLRDLRLIAADPRLTGTAGIGRAVDAAFTEDTAASVLAELDRWLDAGDGRLRGHVAWSLLFLANRVDETEEAHEFLRILAAVPDYLPLATRLWCVAMTEPTTTDQAWQLMRSWVVDAARTPGLADVVEGIAAGLADTSRSFRMRAKFHLKRWRPDPATADLVDRIRSEFDLHH